MMSGLILHVSLWIHPGQEAAFEAFEREAARAMGVYGGRIEQAVRLDPGLGVPGQGAAASQPFEIHLVSFPSESAWESYRAGPEAAALAGRRAAIIARTEVQRGRLAGPYG